MRPIHVKIMRPVENASNAPQSEFVMLHYSAANDALAFDDGWKHAKIYSIPFVDGHLL